MPIRKPSDDGEKPSRTAMEIAKIVGKKVAKEKVLEWYPDLPIVSPQRELSAAGRLLSTSWTLIDDIEDITQDVNTAYRTIFNWIHKWRPSGMSPEEKDPLLVNYELERMALMKRASEVRSELEQEEERIAEILENASKHKIAWWRKLLYPRETKRRERGELKSGAKRRELKNELEEIYWMIFDIDRGIFDHENGLKGE